MKKDTKIGILGGGQLGKMLVQAGSRWDLDMWILEKAPDFPAVKVNRQYVQGDFTNYDDVLQLGKLVDVITIEIENVNTDALRALQQEGKKVYPSVDTIETIKDKGLQKVFYREHDLPTSDFAWYDDAAAIRAAVDQGKLALPFVQKSRTEGYDGRGVQIVKAKTDLDQLLEVASVVEDLVPIAKELAVTVARNPSGEMAVFPIVEMAFHPEANLVEELICPARIDPSTAADIEVLARRVAQAFDLCGILAIELFLTPEGKILINESAPRPHNSGHHTIEANITSQYEQLLRAILDLPLGRTDLRSPAVMINLLGAEGFQGPARYEGLETCLQWPQVYLHLYGKAQTKPFRKMGHATILNVDLEQAIRTAKQVTQTLKIVS